MTERQRENDKLTKKKRLCGTENKQDGRALLESQRVREAKCKTPSKPRKPITDAGGGAGSDRQGEEDTQSK